MLHLCWLFTGTMHRVTLDFGPTQLNQTQSNQFDTSLCIKMLAFNLAVDGESSQAYDYVSFPASI